ncbi:MAG: hypothetical protein IJ400_06040 [Clostridia bacterium]|nr:hypothetical protein [Clostridia bacterium]
MHTVKIKHGDECFKSLIKLYDSGTGFGKGIYTVKNNTIEFNGYTFVMQSGDDNDSNESNGGIYPMEADGAPWFANFRRSGEEIETNMAKWKELITEVSRSFHQTHTWLRYDTSSTDADEDTIKRDKNKIQHIIDKLWYDLGVGSVEIEYKQKPNIKDEITTIYGASLRLGICVEEPKEEIPIVGRIYFKRGQDNSLEPLSYKVAERISQKLKVIDGSSNEGSRGTDEDNYSFNELETALRGGIRACLDSDNGNGLSDYLLIKSEKDDDGISIDDNKVIEELITEADDDVSEIVCKNMKILYIFQVRTKNRVYEIKYNNQPVLSVTIDMNEELSIRCLTCNEPELLIERNAVSFRQFGENGKEESVERLVLDFDEATSFGLSQDADKNDFKRVKSKLSDHAMLIDCSEINGCTRVKCRSNVVPDSEMGGNRNRNYCDDCSRCEVIYRINGKPYCTKGLVYDFQLKDLIVPKKGQVCKVCERRYFNSSLVDDMCDFCYRRNETDEEKRKSKQLYYTYSDALAPFTRLKHLFSDKSCYEDEEIIVFKLGNEYYTIDKLQAMGNDKKFLPTAIFKHRMAVKANKE